MNKKPFLVVALFLIPVIHVAAGDLFGFLKKNRLDSKGERQGRWVFYWDDAHKHLESKGHFKHGLAVKRWKYFSADGRLTKKERYSSDRTIIYTRTYHPNGKLEYNGLAKLIYENGNNLHYYWSGPWKYFSPEGKYLKTQIYISGKVIQEIVEK